MHIPHHWAEAKVIVTSGESKVTIRRFGWSDTSESDALLHAQRRVHEAAVRWPREPQVVSLRERKVPYNGADGFPIREEIIDEGEGYVVTRNSYGALCLNTPDVLIADVDMPGRMGRSGNGALGIVDRIVSWFALFSPEKREMTPPSQEKLGEHVDRRYLVVRQRVLKFLEQHPGWGVRVYETPNGFRLIATQGTFVPSEGAVGEFFRCVGADPLYVKMCMNQSCFRARLTAKPWRCGLSERMRPRSVWPISSEQMPVRERWIEQYQSVARGYASCRWLETLGPEATAPYLVKLIELHDRLSQAQSQLPLA
ncbi:hypothetical protein VN12_07970 [Pirellula sp. SH-Sr6A]|uniref:hypothetical protein n=1 Tax=Pirellula sp. SH-Sr6A TaxID=1632865 RepID=UPI00078BA721|nr:hypothetical protein [Pirellula sp. SH-Sr6A]AMV32044.1 hypothetical protein VN12_07970 [Pirellula sp. SH-Sr6A]